MVESTSLDYVVRVNRAIDFILQNLDQPLPLEAVAKAAHFSPFHFHRLFSSLVGESLNEFVKRVRLERAVSLMSRKDWTPQREQSLTEIAFACGFNSSSDFSRCFKLRYGIPPSAFDVTTFRTERRKDWQDAITEPGHRHLLDRLPPGENPDGFTAAVRHLPPRTVAYHRVLDSYREGVVVAAIEQMVEWAESHGLADGQWLGYSWDNPEIVGHQHCRYDVGLEVPHDFPTRDVNRMEFPAMQLAEVEIRGPIDVEMRALDWLFTTWLPTSGYAPADHPCFEVWNGRPFAYGYEYFELLIHIPIE